MIATPLVLDGVLAIMTLWFQNSGGLSRLLHQRSLDCIVMYEFSVCRTIAFQLSGLYSDLGYCSASSSMFITVIPTCP